jgi:hypothetical protein
MRSWFKISIILICFSGIKTNAQVVKRLNLITQLKADKESNFVINGLAYFISDTSKLDEVLSKIETSKISEIAVLKNDGKISHQRKDVIIIQYATQLEKKIIKAKFKEIKPKFKDEYLSFSQHVFSNAKDPILYLNGNKIHHTKTTKAIASLKRHEIGYIYLSDSAQSEEYHGQNAINGIVIIWTKDKLNQKETSR